MKTVSRTLLHAVRFLVVVAVVVVLHAQLVFATTTTYYVDFGLSTIQTTTTGWNNLVDTTTGGPTLTLVDSTGATSTHTLHITDSFYYNNSLPMDSSINQNGTSSSTIYPSTATRDSFFLGTLNAITDTTAQITVGGLNNSNTYDFKFYASRVAGDAANRTTDYVIGTTTVSLNATDNVDNTVSITGVSPSAGSIVITINKEPAATFGYLGVLEITEHASTSCMSQVTTGNWNTAGTWSCGHVPNAGDTVTITTGNTITMDVASNVLNTVTVNGTLTTANYNLSSGSLTIATGGTVNAGNSNITLSGSGTPFSNSGTFSAGTSTVKLTDASAAAKTVAGGGATFDILWLSGGTGTGSYTISGSNTFGEFKDTGTVAHSILFTAGTTQTISTWTVSGSAGNLVTLDSTTTGTYSLVKTGAQAKSDYLNIQHSVATPASTWYAGSNSVNNQGIATAGSGWIFQTLSTFAGGGGSSAAGGESTPGAGAGTCADGIQNGNETGIDTGGRCANTGGTAAGGTGAAGGEATPGAGTGTCSDGIKNGNETGIDTGGRCANTGGGQGGGGGDSGSLFNVRRYLALSIGGISIAGIVAFLRSLFFK